tara:strand:+ start:2603 stop:2812 length:210 start_codon:yes stop_codon:yes gene_type:complete
MNASTALLIIKLIDVAIVAATAGPQIMARFRHLSDNAKKIISEGRDPTDAEWADLDALADEIAARIEQA